MVVMTESVFERRFTYGNIMREIMVERVPDANLCGVFCEAFADKVLESQSGRQRRTPKQLRDLADEDLAAEISLDVILRRLCSALPAALAADDRLLLFGAAARQQNTKHFERQRKFYKSAVFVKGVLLDRQKLLHQPCDLAPLLRAFR